MLLKLALHTLRGGALLVVRLTNMQRNKLISMLEATSPMSEGTQPNGTILLGHLPVVGPLAYLHTIFCPASEQEILGIERELGRPLPEAYRTFLSVANGLNLLTEVVALFGYRGGISHSVNAVRQPFNIVTPNEPERPRALGADATIVGFYRDDGSVLVMRSGQDCVWWMSRSAFAILSSWKSLDDFLSEEIPRLAALLGPSYKDTSIHSTVSTLPRIKN